MGKVCLLLLYIMVFGKLFDMYPLAINLASICFYMTFLIGFVTLLGFFSHLEKIEKEAMEKGKELKCNYFREFFVWIRRDW